MVLDTAVGPTLHIERVLIIEGYASHINKRGLVPSGSLILDN